MKTSIPAPRAGAPFDIAEAMRTVRTKSQLAALFRYLNLHPTRALGQNFLVDHNLLDFLVRTAGVGPTDLALDIGSGTGLLTAHLADAAARVLAIETDRRVFAIASRYLEGRPNVSLLLGDALASKHELSPLLLDAVREALAAGRFDAFRVVANLPYSAASLIVPNLLESGLPITNLVVTVQKEVAERMAAAPGTPAYGALSVLVQAHARAKLVRDVPPTVFWPRPAVQSAILRLDPDPQHLHAIRSYAAFAALVRAAFGHRRKTLLNSLLASRAFGSAGGRGSGRAVLVSPALGPTGGRGSRRAAAEALGSAGASPSHTAGASPSRAAAEALLARCGLDPAGRAEDVTLHQYIALANSLAERGIP